MRPHKCAIGFMWGHGIYNTGIHEAVKIVFFNPDISQAHFP